MGILDKLNQRVTEIWDDLTLPARTREELEQAEHALAQGEAGETGETGADVEAETVLLRLTAQHPDLLRGWTLLGMIQLRQGKFNEALSSLERACQLQPDEPSLWVSLAEVQQEVGQSRAAIKSYKQALVQKVGQPLLAQIFGELGAIYLHEGEMEHAVRELRKAAALSEGQDLVVVGQLGLAQYHAGDLFGAGISLGRAATAAVPAREVLLMLSRAMVDLEQPEEGRLAALRLIQENPHDVQARCALARSLLAAKELEPARQELLRALEDEPRFPPAHMLLGEVYMAAQDPPSALRHLRTADMLISEDDLVNGTPDDLVKRTPDDLVNGTPDLTQLLRWMLRLELDSGDLLRLGEDADRLLALVPEDSQALACSAIAGLEQPGARDHLLHSLALTESFEAHYGLGLLHLSQGDAVAAMAALRAALRLRPESALAQGQLLRAFAGLSGIEQFSNDEAELYPLLDRIRSMLLSHPLLNPLSPEMAQIQEIHDRPLLITVMGEFNSGKSTFINAFIGERVAPMGVTPTTATINILKYGTRRSARVIWRDDREQTLEWDHVGQFLDGLDQDQAREIRFVELLYPAEELLRINVVDTPGLNSMIDAHELTAREFMAQADAVIWLFSAGQAGSRSEEQALELLREHRLKTVGVINKIDQLSPEELQQIQTHLERGFASLVEAIIPVSARQGLEALESEGLVGLEESRFSELCGFLERRIFSRSLAIKYDVCLHRSAKVLRRAETLAVGQLQQTDLHIEALESSAEQRGTVLTAGFLEQELQRLQGGLDQVYLRGAEEVLDFVRPRQWVLGAHRAAPADRDFLVGLLLSELRALTEASYSRMANRLSQAAAVQLETFRLRMTSSAAGDALRRSLDNLAGVRLSLLEQQVYTRFLAFARGALLKGQVDAFFARRLPRLELAVGPIRQALMADGLEPEEELLVPLESWYRETLTSFKEQHSQQRQDLILTRLEQDQRLLAPVLSFQRRIAALDRSAGSRREDDSGN